jgi:membrane protease YdiL (CAAX protease family)
MTQARDAGLPVALQVILSAVLFGLAHVGWGGLTGHLEIWPMIAAMAATMILGALLAVAYLASRRSLMPVIAGHAAIDMAIEPWLLLFMVSGARFG